MNVHGGHVFRSAAVIDRRYRRNYDYELWGSKYKHLVIWRAHHGIALDPEVFIIHHADENKKNNEVCANESGHCPVLNCGNLGPMTRREHILHHRPGKMSGKKGFVDTKPRKRRAR